MCVYVFLTLQGPLKDAGFTPEQVVLMVARDGGSKKLAMALACVQNKDK